MNKDFFNIFLKYINGKIIKNCLICKELSNVINITIIELYKKLYVIIITLSINII